MKIEMESVKDYLVNSFEHEPSVAEGVELLADGKSDADLRGALLAMLQEWSATEYQQHLQTRSMIAAEQNLERFIRKYLHSWLAE